MEGDTTMGMEELSLFLSPAGSMLGEVVQRVLDFLSVQDMVEYVASTAGSFGNGNSNHHHRHCRDKAVIPADTHDGTGEDEEEEDNAASPENSRRQRKELPPPNSKRGRQGEGRHRCRNPGGSGGSSCSPEDEVPHHQRERAGRSSTTGAGDEAGGGSRSPSPHRNCSSGKRSSYDEKYDWRHSDGVGGRSDVRAVSGNVLTHDCSSNNRSSSSVVLSDQHHVEGRVDKRGGGLQNHAIELGEDEDCSPQRVNHNGDGVRGIRGVRVVTTRHHDGDRGRNHGDKSEREGQRHCVRQGPNVLGVLIGLGLHPWTALGALRGGVAHLLGGVPLLALLRWAAGGASAVLGMSFRVALLPYDVTKGAVSYVVGSLEAMLNIATEIWFELRHLSLAELAVVISCVVSGSALPDFLVNPHGHECCAPDGGSSGCRGGGETSFGGNSRNFSGSSRGTPGAGSVGTGGFLSQYVRGSSSGHSGPPDSRGGGGASVKRGAWQQAHALRRRLDRVNRTASLVSYEERAESAVPKAKAQRVRRRMHYAMSLQCFQATVTLDGRQAGGAGNLDAYVDEDDICEGGMSTEGGSSAFMCTPQSFPPTPVSRAHVMARTSQFSDDVLFLARDQLRLGENLKPGVDETTRATAAFLRRQQRLAVLDGNNACEGIVLTCGHHRATKVGSSLYSSARAMVPVLRNRYVYFQVSCVREGPLAPSIGIGLSTPEMPLSTLVGAFSNSVGLCSTGQVLVSSRWYGEPGEYAMRKASMSTVGVLVYLDGSRPFRSWDGDMVRALVSFSVDGRLVRVATGPTPQAPPPGAASAVVCGVGGGRAPQQQQQQQQQQLSTEGPPAPTNVKPLLPSGEADAPPSGREVERGTAQQQPKCTVASGVVPSSSVSPPEEEKAPWEGAAASAGLAAGVVASAGRGPAAGGATPALGGPRAGAVAPASETSAALGLALPKDRDLFPTVTIHSADTEVLCRFCADDLLRVTREGIGAPEGEVVYALDGSLIKLQ